MLWYCGRVSRNITLDALLKVSAYDERLKTAIRKVVASGVPCVLNWSPIYLNSLCGMRRPRTKDIETPREKHDFMVIHEVSQRAGFTRVHTTQPTDMTHARNRNTFNKRTKYNKHSHTISKMGTEINVSQKLRLNQQVGQTHTQSAHTNNQSTTINSRGTRAHNRQWHKTTMCEHNTKQINMRGHNKRSRALRNTRESPSDEKCKPHTDEWTHNTCVECSVFEKSVTRFESDSFVV